MRSAQAGRDRAQGTEQAAVRAHPARQHPGRGTRNRRADRYPAARRGHPAAHRRRRAARRGRLGGGRAPGRGARAGRSGHRHRGAAAPGGQGARGGRRRGRRADREEGRDVRRAAAAQGQAFPADLRGTGRAGRPGNPGGARPGGQPLPPGYQGVHRGGQRRGVRVHRGPARPGRPAGRDERPRRRADVRRHRLAGSRVPDDAPRPALLLPPFLRHAADRPRVDLQGLRAGPRAGQVPGRVAAVRGAVRQGPAGAGHLRRGPAADRGPAAADAQDRRGPGPQAGRHRAHHGRLARPGEQPDPG